MRRGDQLTVKVMQRLLCEARKSVDLGNIVFSPNRTDGAPTGEPDTPDEAKLYEDLLMWVFGGRFQDPETTIPLLKKLLTHPRYKKFFVHPQAGSVLYRGISSVPIVKVEGWLSSGGHHDALEAFHNGPRIGHISTSLLVKPGDAGATSWTYDETIARIKFSETKDDPGVGKCDLVFEAAASDNKGIFLDMTRMQSAVADLRFVASGGEVEENEMEVIALGQVTLSGMRWRKSRSKN